MLSLRRSEPLEDRELSHSHQHSLADLILRVDSPVRASIRGLFATYHETRRVSLPAKLQRDTRPDLSMMTQGVNY